MRLAQRTSGQVGEEDARLRRLGALFRMRARVLLRSVDPTTARVVRLLPALFHATFPSQTLRGEPPGVAGLRASMRWAKVARDFDLPPPTGIQRGRRLVAALLVTHRVEGLEVHVVPASNLAPLEEQRIAQRARAVETLIRRRAMPLQITPTGPSAQPYDVASRARLLSFGALLAGRLPSVFFDKGPPSPDPLAARLWLTAPTALARTLSLLTLEAWPGGEMAELEEVADLARLVGQPLWRFAEPGLFMAARAALRSRTPSLPFAVCGLAAANAPARRAALALARHLKADHTAELDDEPTCDEVLGAARAVAVAITRSVRNVRGEEAAELRGLLSWDFLPAGCPRVLLPALKAALKRSARGAESPPLIEVFAGASVQVRLGTGVVFGQGHSSSQAWVRALALLAAAVGRPVVPPGLSPVWRQAVPRLLARSNRRSLWISAEPKDRPAPPHDPLNRGPAREFGLSLALVVLTSPVGRASARQLEGAPLTELVLRETRRGSAVNFGAAGPEGQQLEARLTRLARRCRSIVPAARFAVEAGGEVLVVSGPDVTRHGLARFARRPMHCVIDPEGPDFGAEVSQGIDLRPGPNQVEGLVWASDATSAQILYVDSTGWALRETVPLDDVEKYLAEAQQLLRVEPRTALSLRVAESVVRATISTPPRPSPDVEVSLAGEAPFGLVLEIDNELFGRGNRWGWAAAASLVLSRWPPGGRGAVRFGRVDVSLGGAPSRGIGRLYARSVALRRLHTHMETLCRT